MSRQNKPEASKHTKRCVGVQILTQHYALRPRPIRLPTNLLTRCRFYSARNARIASAVLATAIPSVRPSVRLSVRLSHAGIVSKRRRQNFNRKFINGRSCACAVKMWLKIALNAVRLPKFEAINGKSWSPRTTVVKDLRQR